MEIGEYSYSELDTFDDERRRYVSEHTNKRYFDKIPVLPDVIDEKVTKMNLVSEIQRVPFKASNILDICVVFRYRRMCRYYAE